MACYEAVKVQCRECTVTSFRDGLWELDSIKWLPWGKPSEHPDLSQIKSATDTRGTDCQFLPCYHCSVGSGFMIVGESLWHVCGMRMGVAYRVLAIRFVQYIAKAKALLGCC